MEGALDVHAISATPGPSGHCIAGWGEVRKAELSGSGSWSQCPVGRDLKNVQAKAKEDV